MPGYLRGRVMKFTLTIELDNDAFGDPQELARILRKLADSPDLPGLGWAAAGDTMRVADINGNTVGGWKVTS